MDSRGLTLDRLTPAHVGVYINALPGCPATIQQHLSAIRKFFSHLLVDLIRENPALIVEGPRLRRAEGKTPAFDREELVSLLDSIERDTLCRSVGPGADLHLVFHLRADLGGDRTQPWGFHPVLRRSLLRLHEEMGLEHELPCQLALEELLLEYIELSGIKVRDTPMFQPVRGCSLTAWQQVLAWG